jgi:hypothetical protein
MAGDCWDRLAAPRINVVAGRCERRIHQYVLEGELLTVNLVHLLTPQAISGIAMPEMRFRYRIHRHIGILNPGIAGAPLKTWPAPNAVEVMPWSQR